MIRKAVFREAGEVGAQCCLNQGLKDAEQLPGPGEVRVLFAVGRHVQRPGCRMLLGQGGQCGHLEKLGPVAAA